MTFDWFPWWVQHWRRDTKHLTLAEKGAYHELIDEYMLTGLLPDNDRALTAIIGCTLDEWLAVSVVVRGFFHPSNGRLIHKRCEQERKIQLMRAASCSAQRKHASNVRWNKYRELHAAGIRPGMQNHATIDKIDKKEATNGKLSASSELAAIIKTKKWR